MSSDPVTHVQQAQAVEKPWKQARKRDNKGTAEKGIYSAWHGLSAPRRLWERKG